MITRQSSPLPSGWATSLSGVMRVLTSESKDLTGPLSCRKTAATDSVKTWARPVKGRPPFRLRCFSRIRTVPTPCGNSIDVERGRVVVADVLQVLVVDQPVCEDGRQQSAAQQ